MINIYAIAAYAIDAATCCHSAPYAIYDTGRHVDIFFRSGHNVSISHTADVIRRHISHTHSWPGISLLIHILAMLLRIAIVAIDGWR